jgi:ribulose-phosphate 3-epimerase
MVRAMRGVSDKIIMDIHLCVDRPERYVKSLAEAGASCIIFQLEAVDSLEEAISLRNEIKMNGMQAGISINPSTTLERVKPLLSTNLFDVIDVLAVEPGFGGQQFQDSVISKIAELKKLIVNKRWDTLLMIDGGMNDRTSPLVIRLGADIVVAGTYLFRHKISIEQGLKEMLHTE